jgi:hypothetical protein
MFSENMSDTTILALPSPSVPIAASHCADEPRLSALNKLADELLGRVFALTDMLEGPVEGGEEVDIMRDPLMELIIGPFNRL